MWLLHAASLTAPQTLRQQLTVLAQQDWAEHTRLRGSKDALGVLGRPGILHSPCVTVGPRTQGKPLGMYMGMFQTKTN